MPVMVIRNFVKKRVGVRRLELPTSTSRTWRASQLCYTPRFFYRRQRYAFFSQPPKKRCQKIAKPRPHSPGISVFYQRKAQNSPKYLILFVTSAPFVDASFLSPNYANLTDRINQLNSVKFGDHFLLTGIIPAGGPHRRGGWCSRSCEGGLPHCGRLKRY